VVERPPAGPPGPGYGPPRAPWANWWLGLALLGVLAAAGVIIAIFALRNNDNNTTTVTITRRTLPPTSTSTTTQTTSTTSTTTTTQAKVVSVPNVVGETQVQAGGTVQDLGLVPQTAPVPSTQQRGTVVAQNPKGGSDLTTGQDVRLNISVGTGSRPSVQVPDVTGLSADDARKKLWSVKLTVATLPTSSPSSQSAGNVVSQQPSAGVSVQLFSRVTINVGG
jgi:beta-lactam-binding protein with PASTA domain